MSIKVEVSGRRVLRAEGDVMRFDVSIPEMGDGNPAIDLRGVSRMQATEALRTLWHGITAEQITKLVDEIGNVTITV